MFKRRKIDLSSSKIYLKLFLATICQQRRTQNMLKIYERGKELLLNKQADVYTFIHFALLHVHSFTDFTSTDMSSFLGILKQEEYFFPHAKVMKCILCIFHLQFYDFDNYSENLYPISNISVAYSTHRSLKSSDNFVTKLLKNAAKCYKVFQKIVFENGQEYSRMLQNI